VRKHVRKRQQRLRLLGQEHMRTMCRFCKAAKQSPIWAPFCSQSCQLDFTECEHVVSTMERLARQESR